MKKVLVFSLLLCLAGMSFAQSPQLLNIFGPSSTEGWVLNFGAELSNIANPAGLLTWQTFTASGAISDPFNNAASANYADGAGGVDLTNMSNIVFNNVGYTGGASTIAVQFFVQASPASAFVALGPDVNIPVGTFSSYTQSIAGLTAAQIRYIRTIGLNIRAYSGATAFWSMSTVQSIGTPLVSRVYADFTTGSTLTAPAGGVGIVIVDFDNAGVVGNNLSQNTTGLSLTAAGTNGSLTWTDLSSGNGGAIAIWNGSEADFNGRPTDLSNYSTVNWRIRASGNYGTLTCQLYIKTGSGFTFVSQSVPMLTDGTFKTITQDVSGTPARKVVQQIGINLAAHAYIPGNLTIDVDTITAGPSLQDLPEWNIKQ